eukprot:1152587-Pyramimonas_sp.AAC.1
MGGLFGNDDDKDLDPMVLKWFRDKLHNLAGYEDTMWQDAIHGPAFSDFVLSFRAMKVYGYFEGEGTERTLNITYNPHSIQSDGQVLYFTRDSGLLTPETLPHLVSWGRGKPARKGPQFQKTMSDLQILMKRREAKVAATMRPHRPPRFQDFGPTTSPRLPRSGSLMPCFLAQTGFLPQLARPPSPSCSLRSSLDSAEAHHRTVDVSDGGHGDLQFQNGCITQPLTRSAENLRRLSHHSSPCMSRATLA